MQCPIVSPYMGTNVIRTGCADFENVRLAIHDTLSSLSELSFTYDADEFVVCFCCEMKHTDGSFRKDALYCYWDPKAKEHVIDVVRLSRDGFYPFPTNVYDEICRVFDPLPDVPIPPRMQIASL